MKPNLKKIVDLIKTSEGVTLGAVVDQVIKLTKEANDAKEAVSLSLKALTQFKNDLKTKADTEEVVSLIENLQKEIKSIDTKALSNHKTLVKAVESLATQLKDDIATVASLKPETLTKTIIERINTEPISDKKSKEIVDKAVLASTSIESVKNIVQTINDLSEDDRIEYSAIKGAPSVDEIRKSIGSIHVAGGGSNVTVRRNGAFVGSGTQLNFTGSGVSAISNDGSTTTIELSGGSSISDGDKGDITVSSSGAVWTIDNLAVTNAKINDVAWSKVTGTPTTLSGYGITDALDGSGTTNQIAYFVDSNTMGSLTTATYPSLTELSYVKGVTSAIQTQLNAKAPTASPTFTGTVTLDTLQASGSGGIVLKNSGGTSIISLGGGGGVNATIAAPTNIGSDLADYHQLAGGTGTITDTATGSSTNININLVPKGTGRLQAGGVNVPTISSTDTLTNKTLTAPTIAGATVTGAVDAGGATSFEIPNSTTPTVDADGEIALDTSVADFSHGVVKYYGGEEMAVIAVPVAELTSPQNGDVITYNSTADEFQLTQPSAPTISPNIKFTTLFESSSRWSTNNTTGVTVNYTASGVSLDTSSTGGRRAQIYTSNNVSGSTMLAYAGSPSFSACFYPSTIGTTGYTFVGIGDVSSGGVTSTSRHAGFFMGTSGSTTNLYASNANGSSQTKSSSLTTITSADVLDVYLKFSDSNSISFYWRKNGGSWSSATIHSTNIPSGNEAIFMDFITANTTGQFITFIQTASFER